MSDIKRVKKVPKYGNNMKALGQELEEAQASLLAQAITIDGLQVSNEEAVATIDSFHKLIAERNKELAWKEAGRLTLKEELGKLDMIIHQREATIDKLNIDIKMLCNGPAPLEPAPIIASMYRVVTNGNRYAPEVSSNGGDNWIGIWGRDRHGRAIHVSCRSYRGAMKYLRKQYGEKADILPREWRAV